MKEGNKNNYIYQNSMSVREGKLIFSKPDLIYFFKMLINLKMSNLGSSFKL